MECGSMGLEAINVVFTPLNCRIYTTSFLKSFVMFALQNDLNDKIETNGNAKQNKYYCREHYKRAS